MADHSEKLVTNASQPPFVVIGAGLAGLTTAIALARHGFSVKLIYEPQNELAATKACHGISTIKGILESNAELFGLKLEGHRRFDAWLRRLEELVGFSRPNDVWMTGVEEKFLSRESFQKDFGRIYRKDFFGAKQVVLQTSDERDVFAKATYPGDWWIDPSYLMQVLWQAAAKLGVNFYSTRVEALSQVDDRLVITTKSERLTNISRLVICAGVNSVALLKKAGMESPSLFAVAGYTFKARNEGRSFCLVKGTSGVAQTGGFIHWGSTSDDARLISDDIMPEDLRHLGMEEELNLANNHLKSIDNAIEIDSEFEPTARWGVRVRTRTRMPFFGPVLETERSTVWLNTGYYKSGVILAHLFAEQFARNVSQLRASELPCFSNH